MANKYEYGYSRPTIEAPEDLGFESIDFNPYYKTTTGRGGRKRLRPNISNKQATDLAKKLGLQAPKAGWYKTSGNPRTPSKKVYGISRKAKESFLKTAEKYYNKRVGSYNKEAAKYNKAWKDYEAKAEERNKELRKPLETTPDRNKIGRAASESKGQSQSRAGQSLRGDSSGRAAYEKRMKDSGKSLARSGKKRDDVTMGRANFEALGKAQKYNQGGPVKAQGATQSNVPSFQTNTIKPMGFQQNMNMGGLPAYQRTSGGVDQRVPKFACGGKVHKKK